MASKPRRAYARSSSSASHGFFSRFSRSTRCVFVSFINRKARVAAGLFVSGEMKKPTSGHSGGGLSMKDVSCLRRQSKPLAQRGLEVQHQHLHFLDTLAARPALST